MAFKVNRCRGVNARTGERCRQPSLKGKAYCRFHLQAGEAGQEPGAEKQEGEVSERANDDPCASTANNQDESAAAPASTGDIPAPSSKGKPKRGAKPGNRNARRHGLFSTHMPADEKELYDENKRLFAEQAGGGKRLRRTRRPSVGPGRREAGRGRCKRGCAAEHHSTL